MTYAADSLHTAWREVTAHLGVPANPRAFRAWRVTVSAARLVDLRADGRAGAISDRGPGPRGRARGGHVRRSGQPSAARRGGLPWPDLSVCSEHARGARAWPSSWTGRMP